LICVYSLSHAPAILSLALTTADGQPWMIGQTNPVPGSNASVLFFFVLMVQLNDVFQYVWSKLWGQHVIAPQINASRTWEGLIGGVLSTMVIGTLLSWATPFGLYWAGPVAGLVGLAGFAGSMTMSGIKRDRGVKDYGTLVSGHAGVLDRIDSLCFAAPVFFHLTRFFFSAIP
jgi:phosphatidate cytidylyltransferase